MKSLYVGNILEKTALKINDNVEYKLGYSPEDPSLLYSDSILDLSDKVAYVIRSWNQNPNDSNNAIFNYYQIGPLSLYDNAIL